MSRVHMAIENITDDSEAWDTYSVMDGMTPYTVQVVEGCEYEAYDAEGAWVRDTDLSQALIDQVIEYQEGE